jgi:hypothetical protein
VTGTLLSPELLPPICGGLLIAACLLVETEMRSAAFAGLAAALSLGVWAVWAARSRAAFAAVLAGALLWTMRRQSPKRRWLMAAGIAVFVAGVYRASHGSSLHWPMARLRFLKKELGWIAAAFLACVPAAFGAWFLGGDWPASAEPPALAALALCVGWLFAIQPLNGTWTWTPLALMSAAVALRRRQA